MEPEENVISWEAKLSAIAAVMFFAPFVKNRVESNQSFSVNEKSFINSYIRIWFVNLIFLIIVLIVGWLNFFWNDWFLDWVIKILSIVIFIISIFSIFVCINDLPMRNENESIIQDIQHKWQILKVYMPIMNFILRFRQENYNMPYWWLKESIFFRTFFIFGTLLLWNFFWIWVLVVVAIRIILLLLNVDIIPISVKKLVNSIFLCNLWEIMAYFSALILSKVKKVDYETVLQTRKQWYIQWQWFWIWIIIQYILFLGILFLLHRGIVFSMGNIILFVAMILWVIRVIIFRVNKKNILRIPVLSEIVSLVFN